MSDKQAPTKRLTFSDAYSEFSKFIEDLDTALSDREEEALRLLQLGTLCLESAHDLLGCNTADPQTAPGTYFTNTFGAEQRTPSNETTNDISRESLSQYLEGLTKALIRPTKINQDDLMVGDHTIFEIELARIIARFLPNDPIEGKPPESIILDLIHDATGDEEIASHLEKLAGQVIQSFAEPKGDSSKAKGNSTWKKISNDPEKTVHARERDSNNAESATDEYIAEKGLNHFLQLAYSVSKIRPVDDASEEVFIGRLIHNLINCTNNDNIRQQMSRILNTSKASNVSAIEDDSQRNEGVDLEYLRDFSGYLLNLPSDLRDSVIDDIRSSHANRDDETNEALVLRLIHHALNCFQRAAALGNSDGAMQIALFVADDIFEKAYSFPILDHFGTASYWQYYANKLGGEDTHSIERALGIKRKIGCTAAGIRQRIAARTMPAGNETDYPDRMI